MAAWLNVALQGLRAPTRRGEACRARAGWGGALAAVGTWAAIAPQGALSLGERLRLSFEALTVACFIVASTFTLRRRAAIFDDAGLSLKDRDRAVARTLSHGIRSAGELSAALPLFVFLAGLQVISPSELAGAILLIACAALAGATIANVKFILPMLLAGTLIFVTWQRNSFETALCALVAIHIELKSLITWSAIETAQLQRLHLMDAAATTLDANDLAAAVRKLLWREFRVPLFCVAAVNVALIAMLVGGVFFSVNLEQRLALELALAGGVLLLFADASALAWRGLLSGVTTSNTHRSFTAVFGLIVALPWVAAWVFSALHSGEAVTLNETAAYFLMWLTLGGAISWFVRSASKEKLQRDIRQLLSEQ